ncbi:MAG: glycosyltransferase [Methanoregulaceae archaeon]|nr:glycosyltransferase [Methanoregulaceae archaeon]
MLRAALVCHDDVLYLEAVLRSLGPDIPATVFLNRKAWSGKAGKWQAARKAIKALGAEIIEGSWDGESEHRAATIQWARAQGINRLLIPDTDEVLSPELLGTLLEIAATELSDEVHVDMDTYWKSPEYVIRPRERIRPVLLINPQTVDHKFIREYQGKRPLALTAELGVLHHLSYCGPDKRILQKIGSWSHKDEVVEGWKERIWDQWDSERLLMNLHPTHPECYGFAERIPLPEVLIPAWQAYLAANGGDDPLHPEPVEPEGIWPRLSVVIPLYGGPEDIEACLDSLQRCQGLISEVIVVDDKSPDHAPEVVERYPFARLVRNPENFGFAATCNRGVSEASGEVVVLLNSDTIVPKAGLIRLVDSLGQGGTVAAAGPRSNYVGHFQRTGVTYTQKTGIELFAEDFATREVDDTETDMLVGFCLAVKRSVWNEVGPFDTGFGIGMFEDNDFCYRLRRAGYRMLISNRAFVHHEGNQSLERSPEDKFAMFASNQRYYEAKWKRDVETGFVSHLPGLENPDPIKFKPERRPNKVEKELAKLVKRADISLFMIAKNEERVLGDCLKSAKPFFNQIVVVDTGSTDKTIEIAKEHGAEVHKFKWCDDFAAARNESMKYATGKWLFWMDADDTLPWATGEGMIHAVLNAPPDLAGFYMKVRFVTDDPTFGTVVDHVKLFRNKPTLEWEHRIHEQILPSIRETVGDVGYLNVEVLHSGYDTSEEGQTRKRERDAKLLALELKEKPDHPFVLFNIGMTHHYNKEYVEAEEFLSRSIQRCRAGETILRKAYALLAVSQNLQCKKEEGMQTVLAGLEACPGDPELLYRKGQFLADADRPSEAVEAYRAVMGQDISGHFSSIELGILGPGLRINLALALARLGNYREAGENLRAAIAMKPGDLAIVVELFSMARAFGDLKTAKDCLDHIERFDGRSETWHRMRTDWMQDAGITHRL